MKFLTPLFVAIAVCSAGIIENPVTGYKAGDRFFYFADDNGITHLIDSQEHVNEEFLGRHARNLANNEYRLFTRANPTQAQILINGDAYSVRNSFFDNRKETIFLAHGWKGNGENNFNRQLTEAFLHDKDVNVIVLDWEEMADQEYMTAMRGVVHVGRGLGQFVTWLTTLGLSFDNIHLVGFSLGGHLVGIAGRTSGGRVARITSLDPAGPLWHIDNHRLNANDGKYVEVIHTNTAFYGFSDPCGDADFYPNGGNNMPGCASMDYSCSHGRAYQYMNSTIRYNHLLANECGSLSDATRNQCTGATNPMGNSDLRKTRRGIFRVSTGSVYPF